MAHEPRVQRPGCARGQQVAQTALPLQRTSWGAQTRASSSPRTHPPARTSTVGSLRLRLGCCPRARWGRQLRAGAARECGVGDLKYTLPSAATERAFLPAGSCFATALAMPVRVCALQRARLARLRDPDSEGRRQCVFKRQRATVCARESVCAREEASWIAARKKMRVGRRQDVGLSTTSFSFSPSRPHASSRVARSWFHELQMRERKKIRGHGPSNGEGRPGLQLAAAGPPTWGPDDSEDGGWGGGAASATPCYWPTSGPR